MRIYYVVEDWSVDFDCTDSPKVKLFAKLEDATLYYEQAVKNANTDVSWSDNIVEENNSTPEDRYYAVSQDGRWTENHIEVRLNSQDI